MTSQAPRLSIILAQGATWSWLSTSAGSATSCCSKTWRVSTALRLVEVILATDAALAIERFRARRRAMTERGERHPERDIADGDVEAFILDAVDRLTRLPTARPESRIVPVAREASEDEIYRRLLSVLGEKARPSPRWL